MKGRRRTDAPKRRTGALRLLVLALAGVVLGVNLYLWNANTIVGNRLPMPFGYGAAVVLSGSMEPTLSVNDLILVKESESCEVGDIVVYQSGETLIVHRVIAVDGETVTTQGDANSVADEPISLEAVKGVVIARIPLAGGPVRALKTPAGTIILLAAAFLLNERSIRRERQADEEELDSIRAEIRRLKEEKEEEEQQR